MGSSLADRAWSRESAVFRVTGVLSVIGGWFITAGVAFAACAIVCLIMRCRNPELLHGIGYLPAHPQQHPV